MLTGIAVIPAMPRYMPYGWVFVVAVIALILLVFLRVYVIGGRVPAADWTPVRLSGSDSRGRASAPDGESS